MCTVKGFITNLGKYNEGCLLGEWVTFPLDQEELQEVFKRIGINEEYEEYFFTDYQSDIVDLYREFGEYANVEDINELAEELESLDDDDIEKLEAILETKGGDPMDIINNLDDYKYFSGMTIEDVAREIVDSCYDLPEFALQYFDFDAFANDLEAEGYDKATNGVVFC